MSPSRAKFIDLFGCEFPGHACELSLPRLRFELAVGGTRKQRLDAAEQRAQTIIHRILRGHDTVEVELTFWDGQYGLPSGTQMHVLADLGMVPVCGGQWHQEVEEQDQETATQEIRYSASVSTSSAGLDAVIRALVHADHGRWKELSFLALLFVDDPALGLFPYDDRGMDVFAADAAELLPYYRLFAEWLLDYDRPRMKSELGIE